MSPSSDVDQLLATFEAGELLRPRPETPNLVDLARALLSLGGATPPAPGAPRHVVDAIGDADHVVFMLVDGLGVDLIEREAGATFLLDHMAIELHSVFPATTAVALTTLATGEWPAQHAVTGWWTHLPQIGTAATMLPYQRRADEKSLQELGVAAEDAFPIPSVIPAMQRDTLSIYPQRIAHSVYSGYWTGGTPIAGYRSLAEAAETAVNAVRQARGPTFTYLYVPHVDNAAHATGLGSAELRGAVLAVDALAAALVAELGDGARVVVSADHGHLGASAEHKLMIRNADGLDDLLRCAPAGDSRVMHFHVNDGAHEGFHRRFRERFGERIFLLTVDEAEELELMGPGPLSAETRARLGDFIAISRGAHVLGYQPVNGAREMLRNASHHSGLRPEEMRIPLILG